MYEKAANGGKFSIVFGGQSPEYNASLESFRFVYEAFRNIEIERGLTMIYFVNKQNRVLRREFDSRLVADDYMECGDFMPYWQALGYMSMDGCYILNLLHGNYGEDGHIQGAAAISSLHGSFGPVLPASLAMSKAHMNHYIASAHPYLKIPESLVVLDRNHNTATSTISNAFEGDEIVIKPNSLGASLFTEKYRVNEGSMPEIEKNLATIFNYDKRALVQRFIKGAEYSICCLQRDSGVQVLPAIEIRTDRQFFGHAEKHQSGMAQEVIVKIDTSATKFMKDVSVDIFEGVSFENMCRFDFIVTEKDEVFFLEANPIPGLMRNSIFPKAMKEVNLTIPDLVAQFMSNENNLKQKCSLFSYDIN